MELEWYSSQPLWDGERCQYAGIELQVAKENESYRWSLYEGDSNYLSELGFSSTLEFAKERAEKALKLYV